MVDLGGLSLQELVAKISYQPARLLGLANKGSLTAGRDADITIVDRLQRSAFATIIGWNVYGTCAVRYLWGEAGVRVYQVAYMFFAYLGAVLSMELVWGISDLLNSLMALPNLLCLWMLRGEIATDCGKGTDKTSKKK